MSGCHTMFKQDRRSPQGDLINENPALLILHPIFLKLQYKPNSSMSTQTTQVLALWVD